MDNKEFARAQLRKLNDNIHENAMRFIEIATNAAIDQMNLEGISTEHISVELWTEMAAKNLNADPIDFIPDFKRLLELEGMIGS